jgi:hypothetical protein
MSNDEKKREKLLLSLTDEQYAKRARLTPEERAETLEAARADREAMQKSTPRPIISARVRILAYSLAGQNISGADAALRGES